MRTSLPSIDSVLAEQRDCEPINTLHRLQQRGLDRPPLPGAGAGATLARWQMLAAVGAHDLTLAKLYEGHTDAIAILAEAGMDAAAGLWATWCAEAPAARLVLRHDVAGFTVSGRKAWCSGAAHVTHALVSCWNEAGKACLAAVALNQAGVSVTDEGWHAVGMAGSRSVDVVFVGAAVTLVGEADFYVARPGFWHGGAGVAACWFGAAQALGGALHAALAQRLAAGQPVDVHRLTQLGEVDVALQATGALLREAAAQIDAAPRADGFARAMRVRLAVEQCANTVLHAVGRALGAGPLCKDAQLARLFADLPVFLRQSHAERDLEALGRAITLEAAPWQL
ncbi:acyl-CoA dehydrogenase family protein [Massilia sp. S19_KUP03_FR1]|uniref:acyl-CoA dehydrogenase family protein n=1 Tax=Massilia sp. S19_KUP03_FR1 TaxID=3025503 RepID=UPI002FCD63C4